jgi:hypothetical protein
VAKTTDNTARFQAAAKQAVALGISRAAMAVASEMKRGMGRLSRFTSSSPGKPPNRQRSGLANSIGSTAAKEKGGVFTASAGSGIAYARIQERGGTIRPKSGKFLPVPLNKAAQRMLETTTGSLRSRNLQVIRSKTGKLLLFEGKTLRNQKGERTLGLRVYKINGKAVFALRKSVTLKARPWAAPALQKATDDGTIKKALAQAVKRGLTNFAAGVAK